MNDGAAMLLPPVTAMPLERLPVGNAEDQENPLKPKNTHQEPIMQIPSFTVVDNFCEHTDLVRASALGSGFATWRPNTGKVGSSVYDGMNFQARHGLMLRALTAAMGGMHIFPNSCFCRITTPDTERAYIHSDREAGQWTCVAYLSQHEEVSGTAFYRHKQTGLREMPPIQQMEADGTFDVFKKDMVSGGENEWEQLDFVRGVFNRAVIFYAPLFHSRFPMHGLGGGDPETARMVWVSHFDL